MNLAERWRSTLARAGLHDSGDAVFRQLESLYTEKHRAYHDLEHVRDCLRQLDASPVKPADPAALELAIFFHDAIYAPLRAGNEEKSAELAAERLAQLGAGDALLATVDALILVTKHDATSQHADPPSPDEALMVDIDLSMLGRAREVFETYEKAIRTEYRRVPGPLYRRKRKEILRQFLERPSIYQTAPFRERYEARARENLAWAIERL